MPARLKQPIWTVPLAIAGVVAIFGWWGDARLRATLEEQLKAKLTSNLDANVTALEIWTTNQTRLALELTEEPRLHALANRVLEHWTTASSNLVMAPVDTEEFGNYLRPRLFQLGYEIAELVNTNFVVVANSGRSRFGVGKPVSEAHVARLSELFATGQPILITPFKPELPLPRRIPAREGRTPPSANRVPARQRNETNGVSRSSRALTEAERRRRGDFTLMQVAAPIRNAGAVRGALALVINPDKEFTRILSVARSGESGDTYAFDQTGLLISRTRFDEQLRDLNLLAPTNASSALNLRLRDPGGDLTRGFQPAQTNQTTERLIQIVADAVAGGEGVEVKPSRDYRGVPVVGAWRWLPQLGFGVATQMDADEAYRPLHLLQRLFTALFLLLIFCATVLFLIANLTWRRRLSEAELKLKQLGQYTLEEKIGEGGMGVVYRARHALMRRDTAVKLLLPDRASPSAVERFEREVCLTCQLTHPNTIQVYDYGHTPDGIFYYAMEFLRGLNLHQLVSRFGPQPEERVVYILTQICGSLAEAHALGLVHRDIKPVNVFLCDRGATPDCVKVLDFGLVREYHPGNQESVAPNSGDGLVGTPSFMPPESIKNPDQSDFRSDIYSIGVLSYYLLTGKYVFNVESVVEIYQKQMTESPVPPSQCATNAVSLELEQIILRCLDRVPDHRPQSVLELCDQLHTTPHAFEWTLDRRIAWWANYRAQAEQPRTDRDSSDSSVPTVKIDFASRLG